MWQALLSGQPWKGEFINKTRYGTEQIESAVITPLRQPDGRITHYVAVKENITAGTTTTTFSPDANCTRAQIVTFLWRCKK